MSASAATPARRVAYEVLRRVFEHDAWADRSLRSACERYHLEGRERSTAQRLAYGAVQRRGSSDHLIGRLSGRPIGRIDPPLLAALRLGAFELAFDGAAEHAAVDQAVELAKGGRDGGRRHRGAGMVNAVLRRLAREREGLVASLTDRTPAEAAIAHSVPVWIVELWWEQLGPEATRELLAAANRPPSRTYRPTSPEASERLRGDGVELTAAPPLADGAGATTLLGAGGAEHASIEAAVERGLLVPQSRGSALVVDLLGARPGERALDLCAAPGIKASQLAHALGSAGTLTALDIDDGRLAALGELLERSGGEAAVELLRGDGRTAELAGGYDRVLVDAPCSGLGTLASRPDLRWRRGPEAIPPLVALQGELLERAVDLLAAGGRAVYSTCTINRAEGAEVVGAVASRTGAGVEPLGERLPGLADPADPRFLQTMPGRDGTDGFFIAALSAPGGAG